MAYGYLCAGVRLGQECNNTGLSRGLRNVLSQPCPGGQSYIPQSLEPVLYMPDLSLCNCQGAGSGSEAGNFLQVPEAEPTLCREFALEGGSPL